ncbi:hypothetical protein ANTRET_LOCUS6375 [Anthophora retusa]
MNTLRGNIVRDCLCFRYESSIQSIVKCGWTFRGLLTPIPLQALPVRRGGNGRDEISWWKIMMKRYGEGLS